MSGPNGTSGSQPPPSSAIVALRWVAVLPAALLSFLAVRYGAHAAIHWSANRFLGDFGDLGDSFVERLFSIILVGMFAGAALVQVAVTVAPSHRNHVAIGGAGFALVAAGFLLFPSLLIGNLWAVLELGCMAFGACGMAYQHVVGDPPSTGAAR